MILCLATKTTLLNVLFSKIKKKNSINKIDYDVMFSNENNIVNFKRMENTTMINNYKNCKKINMKQRRNKTHFFLLSIKCLASC